MANKYLKVGSNGHPQEVEATTSSAGAGDAGKIVGLDGSGKIASSMLPDGVGADVTSVEAGEDLSAGDWVNLYLDTTLKMRKADASNGYPVDGYVDAAVLTGASGDFYREGTNSNCSGLTIGTEYFLSATAGAETATAPTTAGHIAQSIGKALSATEMLFQRGTPITRA